MAARPRHPKCACSDRHKKTVKLSPSNPNYRRELLGWLVRYTCWEEAT